MLTQLAAECERLQERVRESQAEAERLRGVAEAEWSGLRSEAAKAMQVRAGVEGRVCRVGYGRGACGEMRGALLRLSAVA